MWCCYTVQIGPLFILEIIVAWDDVKIAETDDVIKLLEKGKLTHPRHHR